MIFPADFPNQSKNIGTVVLRTILFKLNRIGGIIRRLRDKGVFGLLKLLRFLPGIGGNRFA